MRTPRNAKCYLSREVLGECSDITVQGANKCSYDSRQLQTYYMKCWLKLSARGGIYSAKSSAWYVLRGAVRVMSSNL